MYIPRLRRINDAIKEIKSEDAESEVTWDLLHRLIEERKISAIKYGNAWLINLDELYGFFKGEGDNE